MLTRTLLAIATSLSCSLAQSVVVPAANATTVGTAQLNSIIRNAANPRTYMFGINASELAGIPIGASINGLSLRFMAFTANAASWPPADITWTNYDIHVGPAIPVNTFTGAFMNNFLVPPLQVRSGPMVLPANTYTNTNPPSPGVNAWGEFYFDFQIPYIYTGGDLALLFSHPGSTDPNTALYPEVVASNAASYGVGYVQSIYPAGTGGVLSTFYVHRLHYGFGTGCPGTGGMAPNLVQSQNTQGGLGGPIRLTVGNAPANSACLIALGFTNVTIPLPNSCNLLTVPVANTFVLLNANGIGSLTLNVPPGVMGLLRAQAIVIDAGAVDGYTLTNGVAPQAF